MTRSCAGYENHDCPDDISHLWYNAERCHACKKEHDRLRQNYLRGLRRKAKRNPIKPVAPDEIEITDALRKQIVTAVRLGKHNFEIREDYGVTEKQIRDINCAHYQRRAKIGEDA